MTNDDDWRNTRFPAGDATTSQWWMDMTTMVRDINDFVYLGVRLEALLDAVKYLRANPVMVKKLITKTVEPLDHSERDDGLSEGETGVLNDRSGY